MIDISLEKDLFIQNDLDAAVQELDMLFNTENTELIGYTDYGTNWWTYLWTLTPLEEDLYAYIMEKIAGTYFCSQFVTDVEVRFLQGTENSIYHIKITLKDKYTLEELSIQQYEIK